MKVPNALNRDDTVHGEYYYLSKEVDLLLQERDVEISGGMTLRDYFAAKVMQAEIAGGAHEGDFPEFAGRAYKMADAMLEARK